PAGLRPAGRTTTRQGLSGRSCPAPSRIERPNRRQRAATHLAAKQSGVRRAEVASVAEGEATRTPQPIGVFGLLAVAGGDHEAVLVIGNRKIPVHLLDLSDAQTGFRQNRP